MKENDPQDMTPRQKKTVPIHPYCVALFPVIALYAVNLHTTFLSDTIVPTIAVILLAILLTFLARLLYANRERAALAVSFMIAMIFLYDYFEQLVQKATVSGFGGIADPQSSLLVWEIVIVAGLLSLSLVRLDGRNLTWLLNVFSISLLVTAIGTIGVGLLRNPASVFASNSIHGVEEEEIDVTPATPMRDVYYLIFDRYPSNETLRTHFGFDNTPFYDRLRERGFYCAPDSHANFPRTVISMASALNMKYFEGHKLPDAFYAEEIQNQRVGRLFRQLGYRYYHLGNWYEPLRKNRLAQLNFRVSPLPSEFADALYNMTPLREIWPVSVYPRGGRADVPLEQFRLLGELASNPHPKFVYAHFILPHEPYLFDQQGPVKRSVVTSRTTAENFTGQLSFANDRIIETIDILLRDSPVEPIIVIQADEGPYLDQMADKELPESEKMRKRSGIISAFHLPAKDSPNIVSEAVTPVNTFRIIFQEYFGADIELLPDRTYYWNRPTVEGIPEEVDASRFVDVTDVIRPRRKEPEPPMKMLP